MSYIALLPRKTDRVLDVSSEDPPHMTLFYFGEAASLSVKAHQYIAHAVGSTVGPILFEVDRRGTLGEDNADVLFLKEIGTRITDLRHYLLSNRDIRDVWESVEQHESWIPHLTLGYPKTPAKDVDIPYYVVFDRVLVDFGTRKPYELLFKEPSLDEIDHSSDEIKSLIHYGVKGMKWGVRRDNSPKAVTVKEAPGKFVKTSGGKNQPASDDAKSAAVSRQKAKKSSLDSLSNKELQQLVTRMNLEQQYSQLSKGSNERRMGSGKRLVKWLGEPYKPRQKTNAEEYVTRENAQTAVALGKKVFDLAKK